MQPDRSCCGTNRVRTGPVAAIMVASRLDKTHRVWTAIIIILFVLGLLASIAWHEAGHLFFAVTVAGPSPSAG